MKKQSILTIVTLLTIFAMSSCNKYEAKEVKLNSQNDSLNYTLGLANGGGVKDYYLRGDSSDNAVKTLIQALDKAYNQEASNDEMYKLGLQIGNSFKQQKKQGLMGDSTLVFDEKLVTQGLINAFNAYDQGMTPQQAEEFIRNYMTAKQAKQMSQSNPQPAPTDTVSK